MHSLWQNKYAHQSGHMYFGIFKCIFFTNIRLSFLFSLHRSIFYPFSIHFAYCFIPFELIHECRSKRENKYAQNITICNFYVFPLCILNGRINMPTNLGIFILAFSITYSSQTSAFPSYFHFAYPPQALQAPCSLYKAPKRKPLFPPSGQILYKIAMLFEFKYLY